MTISGWGFESEQGKQSPVLKKAVVYLISNELCQRAYPKEVILKESKLCAVADNVDTCQGVNISNVLQAAFTRGDPKSAIKDSQVVSLFCTFGICMRKSCF
jgi:hypothetical protein